MHFTKKPCLAKETGAAGRISQTLNFLDIPPGPWSAIGRMPWVSRPAVDAYVTAIAALLFLLLDTPVARSAQGLQVTKPERPLIALMRHDMIGVSRGDNLPIL